MSEHSAENARTVTSLNRRRTERDERLPAPGEPAITFGMDDDRITFRDQDALDEYVSGAIEEDRARVIPPAGFSGVSGETVPTSDAETTSATPPDPTPGGKRVDIVPGGLSPTPPNRRPR